MKLSTPNTKSCPSNPHFISEKEVVIQLERLSDSVVAEMTAGGSALLPEQTKKKMKLSPPKSKSGPSNPHSISEKEVVIQLERLSDSVVAEMTAGVSALLPEQDDKTNDDALGINSLCDEIIVEVFSYLTQNQLGQIARVCRKWNMLTKSPVLWKNVNLQVFSSYKFNIIKSFVNRLPSCVTSIRLDFTKYKEALYFEELCLRLQEKCSNLVELILIHSVLSVNLPAVIDFSSQFLQHVKNLVFIKCIFLDFSAKGECFGISKIEILELIHCAFDYSSKPPFSQMPDLNQLHLHSTHVEDSWLLNDTSFMNRLIVLNLGCTYINSRIFSAIQDHGQNLKELYLCSVDLRDDDLNFTNSVFPHLKTVCISRTLVTCEGVVSLLQSCPSLENVYVDEGVAECFEAHPVVVANRCKTGIVKSIGEIHDHNVDYSHN